MRGLLLSLFVVVAFLQSQAFASPILLLDDFEDGTTENWFAGGGPLGAVPPVPPTNISTGGPGGLDDNFLTLTSSGGTGPGSRLVGMNATQWATNYLLSGITEIEMDLNNLGGSDLFLRLLFEDPIPGPPVNVATSADAVFLPAGSGWTHVIFPILPADLVAIQGTVDGALMNTTILRLFHSPLAEFPGPPVTAQLGIDNISAEAALVPVPEPASLLLFGTGLAAFVVRQRSRRRNRS
jgi:hypothetical protein